MPKTIQAAVLLLWTAFIAGVSGSVLRSIGNQATTGTKPSWVFFSFFLCIVFLFNYFMMKLIKQKKNAARFVVATLFTFGIIGILIDIASIGMAAGILQIILQLGVIVSLFLPSSNEWFREYKEATL